jgi:hypothetical protein
VLALSLTALMAVGRFETYHSGVRPPPAYNKHTALFPNLVSRGNQKDRRHSGQGVRCHRVSSVRSQMNPGPYSMPYRPLHLWGLLVACSGGVNEPPSAKGEF